MTITRDWLRVVSRRAAIGALTGAAMLPNRGHAMWASMTDEELVQKSSLIVMGEWVGQTAWVPAGSALNAPRMEIGAIAVQKVLKGEPATTLVLVSAVAPHAPRSSSDLIYKRGDLGLWLLTQGPGADAGIYRADHPQRFVSQASGAARIEKLRQLIARP